MDDTTISTGMAERLCDVCRDEPMVGVAAIPGVPMSVAYGANCLQAGAHPYGVLVANTACLGGLEQADEGWQGMVEDTCAHLGTTLEQFRADVETAMITMAELDAQ